MWPASTRCWVGQVGVCIPCRKKCLLRSIYACRQLKVYSVEDYRVLQSISYPAPILSMAMSVSSRGRVDRPLTTPTHIGIILITSFSPLANRQSFSGRHDNEVAVHQAPPTSFRGSPPIITESISSEGRNLPILCQGTNIQTY